jgi:hypothetical protein
MARRLAREYRDRGYEVMDASDASAFPPFLHDLHPDLVATRPDDRVVVEIKQAGSLRGSNKLTAMARRVAQEGGWRLEVVTVAPDQSSPPAPPTRDRLEELAERIRLAFDRALPEAAFLSAVSVLEELIRDLAAHNGIRQRKRSARLLARELAFRGLLSEQEVKALDDALSRRNGLVHGNQGMTLPTRSDLDDVLTLCRTLQSTLTPAAAE